MGSQKQSHRVRRIHKQVERLQDSYIDEIEAQQRKIDTLLGLVDYYRTKPAWWKFRERKKWRAKHEND